MDASGWAGEGFVGMSRKHASGCTGIPGGSIAIGAAGVSGEQDSERVALWRSSTAFWARTAGPRRWAIGCNPTSVSRLLPC